MNKLGKLCNVKNIEMEFMQTIWGGFASSIGKDGDIK